jgi:hypothetical protein
MTIPSTTKHSKCRAVMLLVIAALFFMSPIVNAQGISDLTPPLKLDDLTYENPGCKNAWSYQNLDHYLKNDTRWIPTLAEPPYSLRPKVSKISREDYEKIERPSLLGGIGRGGVGVFSSTDLDKKVRDKQVMWLDIDGDGKCDFIGWDYAYTGISARGEQGHTVYYIFLQRGDGFKLIDYTEIGFERWGSGQIPDAILPVWIKGQQQPFLVGRSALYFISANSITVLIKRNSNEVDRRTSLRWNISKNAWEGYGRRDNMGAMHLITEFIKKNPPKDLATPCIETPVTCEAPR